MAYLDHTFGVEIEFYIPENTTRAQCARAVSARLGASDACREENWNHTTRTWWKIVTDRSLGDDIRGSEAVSPILTGADDMEQVRKVMDALDDYGCSVSRLCGLHVHVGVGTHPSADFFRNLMKMYVRFEPVLDTLVPASRRLNACGYAHTVNYLTPRVLDRAPDLHSMVRLMQQGGDHARYHKLNLAAYRKHHTVEFRQHSGTLDAAKAINWTNLCLRMVDAAKAGRGLDVMVPVRARTARPNSHATMVCQMMARPQGVSRGEAMSALGWASISLPQQAAACGIAYRTQRYGHEVRYYTDGAPAAPVANTTAPTTLEGLFDLLDCPDDERVWFRNRAANLAGTVQWSA